MGGKQPGKGGGGGGQQREGIRRRRTERKEADRDEHQGASERVELVFFMGNSAIEKLFIIIIIIICVVCARKNTLSTGQAVSYEHFDHFVAQEQEDR